MVPKCLFVSDRKTKKGRLIRDIIDINILQISCVFSGNNFFLINNMNWRGMLKSLFNNGKETEGFKLLR